MSHDSRASIRSMGRLEVEGWRHGDLIGRWQGMIIGLAGDLDVALRAATTKVPPTAAKASLVQQTRRHPHPPLNKCDGQGGRQAAASSIWCHACGLRLQLVFLHVHCFLFSRFYSSCVPPYCFIRQAATSVLLWIPKQNFTGNRNSSGRVVH